MDYSNELSVTLKAQQGGGKEFAGASGHCGSDLRWSPRLLSSLPRKGKEQEESDPTPGENQLQQRWCVLNLCLLRGPHESSTDVAILPDSNAECEILYKTTGLNSSQKSRQ